MMLTMGMPSFGQDEVFAVETDTLDHVSQIDACFRYGYAID